MIKYLHPHVLVIGQATLDISVRFSKFPMPNYQDIGKEYQIQLGGTAINTAAALENLGVEVSLCIKVGLDPAGRLIRQILKERQINLSHISVDESNPTSLSIINIGEKGEVGILHHTGANKTLGLSDVPLSEIDTFNAMHIAGAMLLPNLDGKPMVELVKQAKKAGIVISLTVARNTERKKVLFPVFPFLDLMFMNEKEAREISGCVNKPSACKWFHNHGVKTIVVTLGAKGAYVSHQDFEGSVPGFKVVALDTTGCGDAFSAGFLYATLLGMSPLECAKWGNGIGAHCARTMGAVVAPFSHSDISQIINRQTTKRGEN
jgi:sugar/nucleoside kinase (ribokinase family)